MENKRKKSVIAFIALIIIIIVCIILITSCTKEEPASTKETVTVEEKNETNSRVEEKEEAVDQEVFEEVNASETEEVEVSTESKKESETKKVSNTSKKTTSTSANTTSSNRSHTHNWVKSVTTVHHDEEGHYERVCVQEAYTREIPVYETVAWEMCTTCGADISGNTSRHMEDHMLKGENGNRRTQYKQVQTGTQTVSTNAIYETKWIVDKAAWDEEVVSYKCSCGATK